MGRRNLYKRVLIVSIEWLKTTEGSAVAKLKTSQLSFNKKTQDLPKSNTHKKCVLVCTLKLVCTSEILH